MFLVENIYAFCTQVCFDEQRYKAKKKRSKRSLSPTPGIRKAIKKRDRVCRSCGKDKYQARGLQVHHIVYRSDYGGHKMFRQGVHDPNNLITLCSACHDMVHSDKSRYQPLLLELVGLMNEGKFLFLPDLE